MPFTPHIPPSLKHRRFFYLWLGSTLSIIGTRMQVWALFWHIDQLTHSPLALGMVGAARVVPIVVFSLFGGVIADAFDRRKMMFLTQAVMVVEASTLGLLTLTGRIELWHIYALTALQALAFAFDNPASQALLPNLVPRKDLSNALTVRAMAFQVGAILGPALAGFIIEWVGIPFTYLINAFSFVAVFIALLLIGKVEQEGSQEIKPGQRITLGSIKDGLKFTFGQPIIFSSMVLDFLATFFARIDTLMPIFAREVLHVGPLAYGWLSAAQSIGAMAAALVISQMKEIKRQGAVLLWSVVIFGISTIVFGLSRSFAFSMLALIGAGASDTVSMIIRNTIRQLQTPDRLRGRMTSVTQIFFMGGPQLGEIEAGVVGQLFGVPMAALSGGIACILGVGWIKKRWPQLASYQGDEPSVAGS